LKTKARFVVRLIYKWSYLENTLDIAIKYSHKLSWYSTTLKMPKTQNLIFFPHFSPFSEPWSHMEKLGYIKSLSKILKFKDLRKDLE
jgi:hypothetical protein